MARGACDWPFPAPAPAQPVRRCASGPGRGPMASQRARKRPAVGWYTPASAPTQEPPSHGPRRPHRTAAHRVRQRTDPAPPASGLRARRRLSARQRVAGVRAPGPGAAPRPGRGPHRRDRPHGRGRPHPPGPPEGLAARPRARPGPARGLPGGRPHAGGRGPGADRDRGLVRRRARGRRPRPDPARGRRAGAPGRPPRPPRAGRRRAGDRRLGGRRGPDRRPRASRS